MQFTKMHGLGNDFIVVDVRNEGDFDFNALAPLWCDRHIGVGADGFLLVLPSSVADIKLRIVNSNGSEAEMCGNGLRCFCRYVYDMGIVKKTAFTVETLGGIMCPEIVLDGDEVVGIRVDIGEPLLLCDQIPVVGEGQCINRSLTVNGREFLITSMAVGKVPHTVVYVDDVLNFDVVYWGHAIEHCGQFPALTNVNFAELIDDHTVRVRTWERGCGLTLACGTGSSSVAVASALTGKTGRSVDILLMLGKLHIEWAENNHLIMTGPAEFVYTGTIPV